VGLDSVVSAAERFGTYDQLTQDERFRYRGRLPAASFSP
jgi:hypothetical protein